MTLRLEIIIALATALLVSGCADRSLVLELEMQQPSSSNQDDPSGSTHGFVSPAESGSDDQSTTGTPDEPPVYPDPSTTESESTAGTDEPEEAIGDDDSFSPDDLRAVCDVFTVRPLLAAQSADEYLPTRRWRFSIEEASLFVHVVMTGIQPGAHEIGLDFYVPGGFLYRHKPIKFLVGEVTGGIQGYAWEYVEAQPHPEGWVVTYALPLAGSEIESLELYGGWRLAVSLNEDPNPVASTWFEIAENR